MYQDQRRESSVSMWTTREARRDCIGKGEGTGRSDEEDGRREDAEKGLTWEERWRWGTREEEAARAGQSLIDFRLRPRPPPLVRTSPSSPLSEGDTNDTSAFHISADGDL